MVPAVLFALGGKKCRSISKQPEAARDGPETPCLWSYTTYNKVGVTEMRYSPAQVVALARNGLIPDALWKGWAKQAKYDPIERARKLVTDTAHALIIVCLSSYISALTVTIWCVEYYRHERFDMPLTAITVIFLLLEAGCVTQYMRNILRQYRYRTVDGEFGCDLFTIGRTLNQKLGEILVHQSEIRGDVRTVLERLGSAFREAREGAEADRTNAELEWDALAKKVKLSDTYDLCLRFGLIEKPRLAWKPYLKKSAQPAPVNEPQAA